jgi:nucleoid-associated protein YgaU
MHAGYPDDMTHDIDAGPGGPDAVPSPDTVPAGPDAGSAALAACPNLVSVDGPWHAAAPSRAHREHCLRAAHVECPAWLEAYGSAAAPVRAGSFVAMAPVVLEGPGIGMPADGVARRLAAPATVVVVGLALGALLLARGPLAPGSSGAGDDGPSATPATTAAAATAGPTAIPTAALTARPTARPTPTPRATAAPRPRTYKIKPGDSLTSIAATFGTTVKKLAALNKITNPSLIRVGQVLKLP